MYLAGPMIGNVILALLLSVLQPWQDPSVNEIGRLPMRADYATDAPSMNLNGAWKFRFYETPECRLQSFYEKGFDDSSWVEIPVPGIWELNGYGDPLYLNNGYAWAGIDPVDPPRVSMRRNHVGQYRRSVDIPASWKGKFTAGFHIPIKINGKIIESPIVSSFVTGAAAGAVGHVAGGTAMGLFEGKSFKESFYNSLNGVWTSALIGGAFSAASTAAVSLVNGINPLNGKEILIRAKYLGITEQEIQHVKNVRNGEPGKFFHDGKEYYNKDGILPENTTYTEYVISRPGGLTPAGTHRIIVGADGSWYYTPDHHTTFFKFKP